MNADQNFSSWEAAVAWLRQQPDQTQFVADCYYDDPLIAAAERYWRSEEWSAVRALMGGATGKALDVGAGRGIASYAMARDGFAVTALEPDPSDLVGAEAIRGLAEASGLDIQVVEEFSERLPFDDGIFDVVFARAVLHHTKDLKAACREFVRVLKPGGRLLAIREHVVSHPKDLPTFLASHPLHRLYGGEHAFTLDEYEGALKSAGLEEIQVISPWHSPVNFAPYNLAGFQRELARRASLGVPIVAALLTGVLRIPGVWPIARPLLARLDRRPGRLYSFVARKV